MIKTEPSQEERNWEQREGPPKTSTAIHVSSTVQGERERKLRPALVQKVVVLTRFNPWIQGSAPKQSKFQMFDKKLFSLWYVFLSSMFENKSGPIFV